MNDFERKLNQIIVNMHLYGKTPSLEDLKRKTGKTEEEIREATKSLIIKGKLSWDKDKKVWII
ncbi:hypothetical protein MOC55_13640 [Bacillus spizizenii]|uniref:Uncharacterized protein n=1 Tax=Bacillus spizizenii TaxID=96241 RepID=A0A9Q4HFX3_BACSC|nr:hypothetical protein [Bacillus spizizenii]MCY8155506.1 hypothetical protein [Bacillus spizizenii]MCY8312904.1 hypothetical protein [Bacillus spizizenii]MCY8416681.1 hypothetical protein [Bacillus spizizenii]MCY9333755.1 hypothetical protein [Bacillus spizizenii]